MWIANKALSYLYRASSSSNPIHHAPVTADTLKSANQITDSDTSCSSTSASRRDSVDIQETRADSEGDAIWADEGDPRDGERRQYDERVQGFRLAEYPALRDACYLDNAAAPPFPQSLLKAYTQKLSSPSILYGNPHSHSPSSINTASAIEHVRSQVLQRLFHVEAAGDEGSWVLVFTSGATASMKLVGESFDWNHGLGESENSDFRYLSEAHTSLVGLRDIAAARGATACSFSVAEFEAGGPRTGPESRSGRRLIGMPLQCNATGRKYDIESICKLKSGDGATYVLLDAAAYLSAHQTLDLSQVPYETAPDFIAFSFYKVFGFPTGLGGLVVKRSAIEALSRKVYFGGGTVDAITPDTSWRIPRKDFVARMEDGTVNFHGILAISSGIEVYDQLFGPEEERRQHVAGLLERLARGCSRLKHGNGRPVCRVYSNSTDMQTWMNSNGHDTGHRDSDQVGDQGATVAFNLLTSNGTIVPPNEVDRLACIQNIHLRAGRHCNAGVVTSQIGASEDDLVQQYRLGMGCDDSANSNVVSASVRVSLNVANTRQDVDRFINFISRFFVQRDLSNACEGATCGNVRQDTYRLKELIVYPIKSCAGQHIQPGQRWPLTPQGLQHDREWVLVNIKTRKALSQKKHHKMALIRSNIDLETQLMDIKFGDMEFSIPISIPISALDAVHGDIAICGESAEPIIHQDPLLNQTLSEFLGISCALARQPASTRHSKLTGSGMQQQAMDRIPLLLSNESPFLLINKESVEQVSSWMQGRPTRERSPNKAKTTSFRGNFTIDASSPDGTPQPFAEDAIQQVVIGPHVFSALGQCRRCQMVAIDQETGKHAPETFLALARHRRNDRGRIIFGMHLTWRKDLQSGADVEEEGSFIEVGMPVELHFS